MFKSLLVSGVLLSMLLSSAVIRQNLPKKSDIWPNIDGYKVDITTE